MNAWLHADGEAQVLTSSVHPQSDCLRRIVRISDDIGTVIVMLGVLDCGDAERTEKRVKLYNGYGFQPLPTNAMRMFPITTIKKMFD